MKNSDVMTVKEMMRMRNFVPLVLPKEYRRFLGVLPKTEQWTMLVHGIAGSGKSTYSLVLAGNLAKNGDVLYGNFEEALGATLINKITVVKKRIKGIEHRISFLIENTEKQLWKQLDTGRYKFCIVDSLSEITNSDKKIKEFWDKLMRYPNVSFILISHARRTKNSEKESDYRGMSTIGHIVDINQRVIEGVVWNDKNRYIGKDCSKADGYNIFTHSVINAKNRKK